MADKPIPFRHQKIKNHSEPYMLFYKNFFCFLLLKLDSITAFINLLQPLEIADSESNHKIQHPVQKNYLNK